MASYDFLLKFLVTGDSGTGKSCLLHQFVENKFKEGATHTIGVEFGSRIVTIGKNQVKLQIWDTAGQERFRSVTRNYYRGAAGALLVYDISNRASFMNISRWIADARKLAGVDISLMLVGNKRDLEDREVSFSEASRFAQENEMAFLETSALTGDGVEETFLKCGRAILSKIETGQLDPERPGSGIQYGDSNLRRISQKNRPVRQKSQCC
ncbi:ras-related protein rab-4B-like protein [Mortierella sp. GBAus27b]|nr:ras-related protein rab-4B-like protein [Mortierella sp. GBAus27b]